VWLAMRSFSERSDSGRSPGIPELAELISWKDHDGLSPSMLLPGARSMAPCISGILEPRLLLALARADSQENRLDYRKASSIDQRDDRA
jgi:hypothetical protein